MVGGDNHSGARGSIIVDIIPMFFAARPSLRHCLSFVGVRTSLWSCSLGSHFAHSSIYLDGDSCTFPNWIYLEI
jgi:hypothetical protein